MGFLFGLVIGAGLSSGGAATTAPMLSQIPLRCLYAFEKEGEAAYRECRGYGLYSEIFAGKCRSTSECREITNKHLTWEIGALHELDAAAKKQAESR